MESLRFAQNDERMEDDRGLGGTNRKSNSSEEPVLVVANYVTAHDRALMSYALLDDR